MRHEKIGSGQPLATGAVPPAHPDGTAATMHNVRNALTPIATILSQGVARRALVDRALLDRALAELRDGGLSAARRHQLVAFVAAAIEAEEKDRESMRRELGIGREAMAHVLEIIAEQQGHAHTPPALGPCDVSEIVALNAVIARGSGGTSIAFSFPSRPHLALANRAILSQVIGNLIGNAAEAITATGRGSGSIAVSVDERGGAVEIRVADDGEGLSKATRERLFRHGFSTRRHKAGGLGLAWCAASIAAMGGTLTLESEGSGGGAVAVLTLAAAQDAAARAA